jgi:hypothetical protein
MIEVRSTDPGLPGNWHLLDRSKPIRKLVDRTSLVPVGRRSLVGIETSQTFTLGDKTGQCVLIASMPADVGNEQTLLACMPWVRTTKGDNIPFKVVFHQAKGNGVRAVQMAFGECPGGVPIHMGLNYVLLNPPVLTQAQRTLASQALAKRQGKPGKISQGAGFPAPAFTEGGPAYVGAQPGATPFQSIYNVLKATDKVVPWVGSSQFDTTDPEKAKANGKGPCGPRSRVAEKALVGVARAAVVTIFHETGSTRHGFLLLEDPETGHYFIGDMTTGEPTLTPHFGSCYILGPYLNEGIPNAFNTKFDLTGPLMAHANAQAPIKDLKPLSLTGSSHAGFANADKCQAWLKQLPAEFRDLEKKLL